DAALALKGGRPKIIGAEAELLVLGADAPGFARLLAGGEVIGKLLAARDRGALDGTGYGHGQRPRWLSESLWGCCVTTKRGVAEIIVRSGTDAEITAASRTTHRMFGNHLVREEKRWPCRMPGRSIGLPHLPEAWLDDPIPRR